MGCLKSKELNTSSITTYNKTCSNVEIIEMWISNDRTKIEEVDDYLKIIEDPNSTIKLNESELNALKRYREFLKIRLDNLNTIAELFEFENEFENYANYKS